MLAGYLLSPALLDHLQAVAVLDQVSEKPVPWIVGEAVAVPITSEDVHFDGGSGEIQGRLYLPVGVQNAPAMVVLHGVHHLGMNEPRLENFASALASCGIQVLTPELPDIKDYRVDAASIQTIGESTRWFAGKTHEQVGVMGLSFSGGLALLAATNPAYRESFRFILTVGAQDSMPRVARYYLTGRDPRPDGSVEVLKPHEYGALVLEYDHVEDFVPAADVDAVRPVLRDHLYEDPADEKAAMAKLTPEQQAETRQLMDTNDPKTLALLAASDAKHAGEMAALSPAGKLSALRVPVFLLHGQADNIIPEAESMWLARDLPRADREAVLVSPVLSHLDIESAQPSLWDEWRLVHFLARVLHTAETGGNSE